MAERLPEEISWSLPLRRCFNAAVKVATDCAPLFVTNSEQWNLTPADQRIAGTVFVLQCHRSGPARSSLPLSFSLAGPLSKNGFDARYDGAPHRSLPRVPLRWRADPCGRAIDQESSHSLVLRLWDGVHLRARFSVGNGCLSGYEVGVESLNPDGRISDWRRSQRTKLVLQGSPDWSQSPSTFPC